MDLRSSVSKVNRRGMLLVYPINNKPQPASLWSEFFPRSEMVWEWDGDADNRVANLWRLRERLSVSNQVVYTKWFRGRATLVSFELFPALVRLLSGADETLSFQARDVLDLLREDSPLSTKALKKMTGLQGRELERTYTKALRELWARVSIVGYGEVDEGAFPSLAVGAAQVIFENLWREGGSMDEREALSRVDRLLPQGTPFRKYFDQVRESRY